MSYIAFEGIDGSGKSTQAAILAASTPGSVLVREPTDGVHGRRIRDAARRGIRLSPSEERELFVADRREHIMATVRPALDRGCTVITDRSYYSSVAYQGARGFSFEELLEENEDFAPRPDLAFLFNVPIDSALERCKARGCADAFESRQQLMAVHHAYMRLILLRRMEVVDGTLSSPAIAAIVKNHLLDFGAIKR